jgi:excisionase family DNA binding protein
MSEQDHLWDVDEVAAYLQLPTSSIYKMTAPKSRSTIPHVRLSGRLRFRRRDIDRWLELHTVADFKALEEVRRRTRKGIHGNDTQAEAPQR